jgi:hypothetical protein
VALDLLARRGALVLVLGALPVLLLRLGVQL